MKTIRQFIRRLTISQRFTVIIFLFALIPTLSLSAALLSNTHDLTVQDKMREVENGLERLTAQVDKTAELCNMSTQVFRNMPNMVLHLERLKKGEEIPVSELLEFYRGDVASMERIVISNPYLYQIRMYSEVESIYEMMPILYGRERMERLPWAETDGSGIWHFDFEDQLFPYAAVTPHVMSLVTKLETASSGLLGTIEVSVRMDDLFPEVFAPTETQWACFVDENGTVYGAENTDRWGALREDLLSTLDLSEGKPQMKQAKIQGEPFILAAVPFKDLQNSTYVQAVSLKGIESAITRRQMTFFAAIIAANLVLVFIINLLTKALLKRMYSVFDTVRVFSGGDLDITVPDAGEDEVGQFAQDINLMLEQIRQLMKDNIDREILIKNSEIRALQNQINAHFIYNVLESIKMMAEIDEKFEIADAVTALGKLMRYSMKWAAKNVSIGEELAYIRNYIILINLRYDYEIRLVIEMPEEYFEAQIPKMSLQPIVENAVNHGLENMAQDTEIIIRSYPVSSGFCIEITDKGRGMSASEVQALEKRMRGDLEPGGGSGGGIGLKNVQDRIRITFGEGYGITIDSRENCYTRITLTLPFTT